MTAFTGIVFRTEFVNGHFASASLTHDCRRDIGIRHNRCSNLKGFAFTNGEDFEFYSGTNFSIQLLDAQNIVLAYAILFTTCANHSVHLQTSILVINVCFDADRKLRLANFCVAKRRG